MKALIASIVAATGFMISGSSMAASMPELAVKSGCTACHKIDTKVVGPAWKDVANKYKGNADVASALDHSIAKGSSGKWGSMPMPPQPKLNDAQRKELVDFIVGLAD